MVKREEDGVERDGDGNTESSVAAKLSIREYSVVYSSFKMKLGLLSFSGHYFVAESGQDELSLIFLIEAQRVVAYEPKYRQKMYINRFSVPMDRNENFSQQNRPRIWILKYCETTSIFN